MNARIALDWHTRTYSAWSMMAGVEERLVMHGHSTPLTRALLQQLVEAKDEMGRWTIAADSRTWDARVARAEDLMSAAMRSVLALDQPSVVARNFATPGFSIVRDEILAVAVRIRRVRAGEAA